MEDLFALACWTTAVHNAIFVVLRNSIMPCPLVEDLLNNDAYMKETCRMCAMMVTSFPTDVSLFVHEGSVYEL